MEVNIHTLGCRIDDRLELSFLKCIDQSNVWIFGVINDWHAFAYPAFTDGFVIGVAYDGIC